MSGHHRPHTTTCRICCLHGLTSKWTYLTRTTPSLGHLLQPLKDDIRTELLPAITGRPPPNDSERDLLALPTRLGGIALVNPIKLTDFEYSASIKITEPLTNAILQQIPNYTSEMVQHQLKAKAEIHKLKRQQPKLRSTS